MLFIAVEITGLRVGVVVEAVMATSAAEYEAVDVEDDGPQWLRGRRGRPRHRVQAWRAHGDGTVQKARTS
ncbi:hypothetical protein GUJ93_ZPchr0013g34095 [Zizania palustris]|uniref:Uncharacterized protein n=1 Tax=Zizania palustris TaxID=103762 RepID=A0A8J5X255_ZIZPA|nr:hypothetical protein GUJ93_ZPchr0013g34095 [Zizania palustris]